MRKKILIVDDEPRIIQALEISLGDEFDLISTHDGESAIKMIRESVPDLVVLDWRLKSTLEGKDVLIFVKREFPEIPVIVVTASIHFLKEIEELKPTASYLKPFPELKQKILDLL